MLNKAHPLSTVQELTEENLENTEYSVLVDPCPGSKDLLISFGGIANRLPIPVFEFMRSLDHLEINKVFIRDFKQCWYTNGIHGFTQTPLETADYLRKIIQQYGEKRCVFIGNSAGAYAAMLYGQILEVSEVHAFSPQTFIDRWHRLIYWDRRWRKEITNLNRTFSEYFDLKKVFEQTRNSSKVHHYIYWDRNHRLDNIHATRLVSPMISYFGYSKGGHTIIKQLRNNGELETIMSRAFGKL